MLNRNSFTHVHVWNVTFLQWRPRWSHLSICVDCLFFLCKFVINWNYFIVFDDHPVKNLLPTCTVAYCSFICSYFLPSTIVYPVRNLLNNPLSAGFYFATQHHYRMDGWIQTLTLSWAVCNKSSRKQIAS